MLAATEEMYLAWNFHTDLSKREWSQQPTGRFMSDGLRKMLEGKKWCHLYMVFPFVAAFLEGCIGISERTMLWTLHTLYLDLMQKVYVGSGKLSWTTAELQLLNGEINHCKKIVLDTLAERSSPILFTLKIFLSKHIVADLRVFGTLSVLDDSPFEHYNLHNKTSYRRTSRRTKTRMEKTVNGFL